MVQGQYNLFSQEVGLYTTSNGLQIPWPTTSSGPKMQAETDQVLTPVPPNAEEELHKLHSHVAVYSGHMQEAGMQVE